MARTSSSQLEAQIDAINAVIAEVSASPEVSASMDGVSYTFQDLGKLLDWRDRLEAQLARLSSSTAGRVKRRFTFAAGRS